MTLTQLARVVIKQWFIVVIGMLVLGGGAFGVSKAQTPQYDSTTSLFFSLRFGTSAGDLAQGSTYTQGQMQSFGLLATSDKVLNPVIDQLGLNMSAKDLRQVVTISTPRSTVIMDVTVADASPVRAARIANALGAEIKTQVEALGPKAAGGTTLVAVSSIQQATPPVFAAKPNTRRNTALGLLAGAILGALIILAMHAFDTRIRGQATLADLTQVPFLGAVRKGREGKGHELVVFQDPRSQDAEDFRKLRASLQYIGVGKHPLTFMVTSAVPREGKSTIACNLAAALAEAGQRTILIDVDLRKPRVADYTRTEGSIGLTDLLIGQAQFNDVVQQVGNTHLDVVSAGDIPPNPGELLASDLMSTFLRDVRARYDFVILDTPPVLSVADAVALAAHVDGALLVVHTRRATRAQVVKSLEALSAAGASPLGAILNGTKGGQRSHENTYMSEDAASPRREGAVTEMSASTR